MLARDEYAFVIHEIAEVTAKEFCSFTRFVNHHCNPAMGITCPDPLGLSHDRRFENFTNRTTNSRPESWHRFKKDTNRCKSCGTYQICYVTKSSMESRTQFIAVNTLTRSAAICKRYYHKSCPKVCPSL